MQMRLGLAFYLRGAGFVVLAAMLLVACSDDATETQVDQAEIEATTSAFEMLNPQLSASAKNQFLGGGA